MLGGYVQLALSLLNGGINLFYGQPELGPYAAEAPHVASIFHTCIFPAGYFILVYIIPPQLLPGVAFSWAATLVLPAPCGL